MNTRFAFTMRHLVACLILTGLVLAGSLVAMRAQGAPVPGGQSVSSAALHKVAAHAATAPLAPPVKTYGSKSAPITVEAYTDYECPGCRALFEQALRPMINDYVASGKVYLIHHDFPLVMHPYSGQAARWANASAQVGDFGAVESALFDNQATWGASGNIEPFVSHAMSASDFQKVQTIMKGCAMPAPQAVAPGADPLAKIASGCSVDTFIAKDIQMGNGLPVTGTPTYTIFFRGQKIATSSNIVSWPILKQFFDSLLSQ